MVEVVDQIGPDRISQKRETFDINAAGVATSPKSPDEVAQGEN